MVKKLPEESIKQPKFGEWHLSASYNNTIDSLRNNDKRNNFSLHFKGGVFKPKLTDVSPKVIPGFRSKSMAIAAPFQAHPPHINDSVPVPSNKVVFPTGTATTDLNDILRSKYKQMKRPLPPLESEGDGVEPQFLPLELFDDSTYEEFTQRS